MSDLISRQAAIDAIHEDAGWLAAQGSDWQTERMERDKSILKSLPSAQPEKCEDCLNFIKARLLIPQPERKKGKWIKMSDADGIYWACSECGEDIPRVPHYNPQFDLFPRLESIEKTNFCPNCGADMRGEQDG